MTELISTAAVRGAIDYFDQPAGERAKLYGTAVFEAHFAVLRQFAKQTLAYEDAKTKPIYVKSIMVLAPNGTRIDNGFVTIKPGFTLAGDPGALEVGSRHGLHLPIGPVKNLTLRFDRAFGGVDTFTFDHCVVERIETEEALATYDAGLHNCSESQKYRFTLFRP